MAGLWLNCQIPAEFVGKTRLQDEVDATFIGLADQMQSAGRGGKNTNKFGCGHEPLAKRISDTFDPKIKCNGARNRMKQKQPITITF